MSKQIDYECRQLSLGAAFVGMFIVCLLLSAVRLLGPAIAVLLPLWWVLVLGFGTGNSGHYQLLYDICYGASVVVTIVVFVFTIGYGCWIGLFP